MNNKYMLVMPMFLLLIVSAMAVVVDPYSTVPLPQIESTTKPLDNTGLERTLLYCTSQVDGEGDTAKVMPSNTCPTTQMTKEMVDDGFEYFARIDYAKIKYNLETKTWDKVGSGMVKETNQLYTVNVPEPTTNFISSLRSSILGTLKTALCKVFPGLEMCQ